MRLADRLPDVLDAERIDDGLARVLLLARPIAQAPPLLHHQHDAYAAQKMSALVEGIREPQAQDGTRRAAFAQPLIHDRERSLATVLIFLEGQRQGLDREARPRERKHLPRRPQIESPGLAVGSRQDALLGAGPGEPVASERDLLAGETFEIAALGKAQDALDRGLAGAAAFRQQRQREAPIAGAVPVFFERQPKLGAVGGQQREMKVTRRRVDDAKAGAPARRVQMVDESRPTGKAGVRRGNDR